MSSQLATPESPQTLRLPREVEKTKTGPRPDRWANGLDWPSLLWIVLIHIGALAAPFFFTWKGLFLTIGLGWVTGSLGVCLGYHRLLTHRSFSTYKPMQRFLGLLGALAGEGPPLTWVAVHRKHHQFSDQQGDPHSPTDGGWWSHVLWLFPRIRSSEWRAMIDHYAPDLTKDAFFRSLDRTFILWHFAAGATLTAIGWAFWDWRTGVSLLVYGMFVRLVYVLHVTWAVNSASHIWGYRNYETTDNSRNLWWVGLLAYGEGWHNNHHAFQRGARHGHRWWELDVTYAAIWTLERLGLAWNVVRGPRPVPIEHGKDYS
jgi:sn-2 palmitoyl-lipid 9-desaturase